MKVKALPSLILLVGFMVLPQASSSQIKVSTNGNVGVNFTGVASSRFSVNSAGASNYQGYFYNPNMSVSGGGVFILSETGSSNGQRIECLQGQIKTGSGNYLIGLRGSSYSSTALSAGRSYGLYGIAGNLSNGYNYAVYGELAGSRNGAAIFGTTNGYGDLSLPKKYAGYFRGDVKVEGELWAATITPSDNSIKKDLKALDSRVMGDKLQQLRPVNYLYKNIESSFRCENSDTLILSNFFNEDTPYFKNVHYGFIAQEIQGVFPELVYDSGDGILGIDYNGLIPILVEVLKEQQKRIEKLEAIIEKLYPVTQTEVIRK